MTSNGIRFFIILVSVFTLLFYACRSKILNKNKFFSSKKEFAVLYKGELRFRKSYASIQNILTEEEKQKFYAEKEQEFPQVYDSFSAADKNLYHCLLKFSFVKDGKLFLDSFKRDTNVTTIFTDLYKQKYLINFYPDSVGFIHFKMNSSTDSVDVNTNATSLQNLDYNFLDIIPGGNKELVFLDDYYIMMGDNYDLKVYEIINEE